MRAGALLMAIVPALVGCHTHMQLRDNTLQTTATLTDLNYQQVLDNVARFTVSPSSLPSIAVVNQGTITVADQHSFNGSAAYSPTLNLAQQAGSGLPILSLLFTPSLSHNLTENWSVDPVTEIDNLRRIRCAFQMLVLSDGYKTTDCYNCRQQVAEFFLADDDRMVCLIPRGWYCIGRKKHVPRNACYVGHYGDTYVWVMPEGIEGLSRFTMTVLELATGKPEIPTQTVVKKYRSDGTLEATEVTTTEVNQEAMEQFKEEGKWPELRRQTEPLFLNPGLFFVPRSSP